MKKIYVGYSRKFDYQKELYEPIRTSELNERFEIVLPHEKSEDLFSSREFFKSCDYFLAEITYPSIGLGIEMGWADAVGVKIICLVKNGENISKSAVSVAADVIEYKNGEDLLKQLGEKLK